MVAGQTVIAVAECPAEMRVRTFVFQRDNFRCRYCDTQVIVGYGRDREGRATIDHVVPVRRIRELLPPETPHRGKHLIAARSEHNLVTACAPCNERKADRTPEEAGMTLLPVPTFSR